MTRRCVCGVTLIEPADLCGACRMVPADDWRPLNRQTVSATIRPEQVRRINDALSEYRAAVTAGDVAGAARALAVHSRARANASTAERVRARALWDEQDH